MFGATQSSLQLKNHREHKCFN